MRQMWFGGVAIALQLLTLARLLVAKPANPTGSYFRKGYRGPRTHTFIYVCKQPTCQEPTQREQSPQPMDPVCTCGSEMYCNKLVGDDFAPLHLSRHIWVCVRCQEPPVRAAVVPTGRRGPRHVFRHYADGG